MKYGEWLLGWCVYRLGDFLAVHGHRGQALPLPPKAVPILDSTMGPQHPRSQLASIALARYR